MSIKKSKDSDFEIGETSDEFVMSGFKKTKFCNLFLKVQINFHYRKKLTGILTRYFNTSKHK